MAATSSRQKRITGRVMHEFKHGELKRSRSGKVKKKRRQPIAIALPAAPGSASGNWETRSASAELAAHVTAQAW